jgi:hypothetical protein
LAALLSASTMAMAATPAAASPPRALILGPTVNVHSGDGIKSLEQLEAEAAGFVVDVLPTWDRLSAADFARYQVLILGDPKAIPSSFATAGAYADALFTEAVWGPVVMASGGSKVLIGADPSYQHQVNRTSTVVDGTANLERYLIQVAGAQPNATGVYIDLSDAYSGQGPGSPLPIMDGLSIHGPGQFTMDGAPNCYTAAVVAGLDPYPHAEDFLGPNPDSSLSSWGCAIHERFDTYPSDWTPFALTTGTGVPVISSAFDLGTVGRVWGAPYILASIGFVANGASFIVHQESCISVAPHNHSDPVRATHTVTATVGGRRGCSANVAGQSVRFFVERGPNLAATGSATTDASGHASFTYADNGGPGTDFISATFTDERGALEAADQATQTWTPDALIGNATGLSVNATEGTPYSGPVATFADVDADGTAAEYAATIDWGDGSSASTGVITGAGESFTVTGSHTYADEGSYTVKTTISDVDNAANVAAAMSTATVADAALAATGVSLTTPDPLNGIVASFTDASTTSASDFRATIDWGDGSPTSSAPVSGSGGSFTVTGNHTYASLGFFTVTTHVVDDGGSTATATTTVLVFATSSRGSFAIGDNNAAVGSSVTFWGAQWDKANGLSGGAAPASFKGFENGVASPACGTSWTTSLAESSSPPATIPTYMAVVVSSHVSQSGSSVSGDTTKVVVVHTDPGYLANPGHPGTGKVVAVLCG